MKYCTLAAARSLCKHTHKPNIEQSNNSVSTDACHSYVFDSAVLYLVLTGKKVHLPRFRCTFSGALFPGCEALIAASRPERTAEWQKLNPRRLDRYRVVHGHPESPLFGATKANK